MDGTTTSISAILKNLIKGFNTLLDCPARFSGEFNERKIHCFVEYIDYYKRIKCIRDDQALRELQHLLLDRAYDWWMRRKANIKTWSEALTILENQYSKIRPAHVVYLDILKHSFEDYQSKDDFIDDKTELFAELSQPELTEKNKLDIIYAILPNDVQNKIPIKNISNFKDLKQHLRLRNRVGDDVPTAQTMTVLNSEITLGSSISLTETENTCDVNKESNETLSIENNNPDLERDPVIKVRKTADLMPQDVKEEEKSLEEFISNGSVSSDINNTLNNSNDNFQIDSDIMNQINNIIDETEMNISAISNHEVSVSTIPQTSNSVISLEFLGFEIEASKINKSAGNPSKSPLNSTKKTKKRCTYCRHFNHTAQVCFKKAKHIKLFPERFVQMTACKNNNSLDNTNNKDLSQTLTSNTCNNNSNFINTQRTEIPTTTPNITNTTTTTVLPTTADGSSAFTNSTMILNNIPERNNNSILTTKLIPAITGKAPNKLLAAKLRNINSPTPKCHQCGTLGFYKSICPNCSPIYNNNSHK